jgi:ankyrin repeat protein
VVQVLLAWVGVDGQRVDPTAGNNYAVRWAASNGHVEVVRLLLKWVGVDGKRVDIEVTRRATKSLAVLAVCDEAASIAAWWSPARVAWMIGVVASN